jgi:hypothetical protein
VNLNYKRIQSGEENVVIYQWDYTLYGTVIFDVTVKSSNGGSRTERLTISNDLEGDILAFNNTILNPDERTNFLQFFTNKTSENTLQLVTNTHLFGSLIFNLSYSVSLIDQIPDTVEYFYNYIVLDQPEISSITIENLENVFGVQFDSTYVEGNKLYFNANVETIPSYGFSGSNITDYYSEITVTISNNAFQNSSLEYLYLENISFVGTDSLLGCTAINLNIYSVSEPLFASYSTNITYLDKNYLLGSGVTNVYDQSEIESILGTTLEDFYWFDNNYFWSNTNYSIGNGIVFDDTIQHIKLSCDSVGHGMYGNSMITSPELESVYLPICESIGYNCFGSDLNIFGGPYTLNITDFISPNLKQMGNNNFFANPSLNNVDLRKCTIYGDENFLTGMPQIAVSGTLQLTTPLSTQYNPSIQYVIANYPIPSGKSGVVNYV